MPLPDTASRATTRVLAVYNLAGRLRVPRERLRSLTGSFDMGRFADHVEAAVALLPQVAERIPIDPALFHAPVDGSGVRPRRVVAHVATTPRHDGLLILDVELAGQPNADDVADFLYSTWHRRAQMEVDGSPIMDWLRSRLDPLLIDGSEPLAFGRNVHQCVFAGGRLARRLLKANRAAETVSPDAITVVFRGTVGAKRGIGLDVRRPSALNNPGETMVAHGRGVSLIVGWMHPVENAFGLAAAGLVNAAGVVHRVRRQALETLELNESAELASVTDVRALITRLSGRLDDLQLDLSFGIEAYADTILIPELLIESYHASLRRIAALSESLANTSRIVDRVAAVVESRRALLDASTQEYNERRDRIFTTTVTAGSLLALPPALLLAFFGVNSSDVDDARSIFDLHHYGTVYLAVWLPFVTLAVTAAVMRRRVRHNMPEWYDIGRSPVRPDREALTGPRGTLNVGQTLSSNVVRYTERQGDAAGVRAMRSRPRRWIALLIPLLVLNIAAPVAAASYPNPIAVSGDTRVHDPSIVKTPNGTYIIASTGTNLELRTSTDRVNWRSAGAVWPNGASWTDPFTGGSRVLWAPDISYRNGRYYLYYAASSFGSQNSAIFLATSPTGLSGSWTNLGIVTQTTSANDYNAIDPNLVVDASGRWWLTFGSFWTGIKMIQLDPATGKQSATDRTLYSLAQRPASVQGAIEAPFIVQRGGFYYLFVSFDFCCRGTSSTYRVMVGRSASITGPYADRSGVPLMNGGGTEVVATHGSIIGPGHEALIPDTDGWLMIYHYYTATDSRLGMNHVGWSGGWPSLF